MWLRTNESQHRHARHREDGATSVPQGPPRHELRIGCGGDRLPRLGEVRVEQFDRGRPETRTAAAAAAGRQGDSGRRTSVPSPSRPTAGAVRGAGRDRRGSTTSDAGSTRDVLLARARAGGASQPPRDRVPGAACRRASRRSPFGRCERGSRGGSHDDRGRTTAGLAPLACSSVVWGRPDRSCGAVGPALAAAEARGAEGRQPCLPHGRPLVRNRAVARGYIQSLSYEPLHAPGVRFHKHRV